MRVQILLIQSHNRDKFDLKVNFYDDASWEYLILAGIQNFDFKIDFWWLLVQIVYKIHTAGTTSIDSVFFCELFVDYVHCKNKAKTAAAYTLI